MGVKAIPLKKFIRWLESKGLVLERKDGSHHYYNYPERDPRHLNRCVTVRPKFQDIPLLHIHTNLKTLGVTKHDFEREISKF